MVPQKQAGNASGTPASQDDRSFDELQNQPAGTQPDANAPRALRPMSLAGCRALAVFCDVAGSLPLVIPSFLSAMRHLDVRIATAICRFAPAAVCMESLMFNTPNSRHSIYAFDVLYEASRASDARGTAALHEALGGESGIAGIVDAFIARVAADRRVNRHFEGVNIVRLRLMLRRHFGWLAGGPNFEFPFVQVGSREAAADHVLFEALSEDLESALVQRGVTPRTRRRFIALFSVEQRIAA